MQLAGSMAGSYDLDAVLADGALAGGGVELVFGQAGGGETLKADQ